MILGIYAMRDSLVGFLQPSFEINDASAIRNFDFAVSRKDTIPGFRPEDFQLCRLGKYDTDTGKIEPCLPEVIK